MAERKTGKPCRGGASRKSVGSSPMRLFWKYTLLVFLAACSFVQFTASHNPAAAQDPAKAFLVSLTGRWIGRAETTPRGSRPYDLHFRQNPDGSLKAIALPGVSEHHWSFSASGGDLYLVFLTTFGGNRTPLYFPAAVLTEGIAVFTTERADRLTVHVKPDSKTLIINIFRNGRLHVAIRLFKSV